MPIHDYLCTACRQAFERLVRDAAPPSCPYCASTALQRQLSLTAPQGRSAALAAAGRRAAARAGHLSHASAAERAQLK